MRRRHWFAASTSALIAGYGLGGLFITGSPAPAVSLFILLAGCALLATTLAHAIKREWRR